MQLELFHYDPDSFRMELERRTGLAIALTITDNASSIMSFDHGRQPNSARLRIHHMFLNASPPVVSALATWLTHRRHRRSGAVLDRFIQGHSHLIRRGGRRWRIRVRGKVHDLQAYYDTVNEVEFDGSVEVPITWGRSSARKRQRSIRLGSFSPEDRLIRIHPHLDQAFVPDYFVRYVVFHEMLHAALGFECTAGGRRRVHTRAFNGRERGYREFGRAMAWHDGRGNIARLLRKPRVDQAV